MAYRVVTSYINVLVGRIWQAFKMQASKKESTLIEVLADQCKSSRQCIFLKVNVNPPWLSVVLRGAVLLLEVCNQLALLLRGGIIVFVMMMMITIMLKRPSEME